MNFASKVVLNPENHINLDLLE